MYEKQHMTACSFSLPLLTNWKTEKDLDTITGKDFLTLRVEKEKYYVTINLYFIYSVRR